MGTRVCAHCGGQLRERHDSVDIYMSRYPFEAQSFNLCDECGPTVRAAIRDLVQPTVSVAS